LPIEETLASSLSNPVTLKPVFRIPLQEEGPHSRVR